MKIFKPNLLLIYFASLFIAFFFLTLFFLSQRIFAQDELLTQDKNQLRGILILEGRFIKVLVLKKDKDTFKFENPEATIRLPIGTYEAYMVFFQDNESQIQAQAYLSEKLEITESKPAILKAGAPLISSILVEKYADTLRMNYYLKDSQGNSYELKKDHNSNPPKFSIYKGDKKIVSDQFSYG